MEVFDVNVSLSVTDAAARILEHMHRSVSCECLDRVERAADGKRLITLFFEKYYYRAGNRLAMMVMIDDFSGETRVHSAGGGGGEGIFIRFDWGASKHFARSAIDAIEGYITKR